MDGTQARITSTEFLYQEAPCGLISFNTEGKIIRVNQTFCNWLGRTADDVHGLKFTSLLTTAGNMYYKVVIESLLNLQGYVNEINFSFVHPDGNFDALFNAISYKNEQGQLLMVNATILKITDRKKYETELLLAKRHAEDEKRRFEFLSNTIPNLFWTTLPSGEVDFVNQRVKDYFNTSDLERLTNFEGVVEEDREFSIRTWKKCLETGKVFDKEVRIQGEGREPEWHSIRIEPYVNASGEIEMWFGSSTNIHKKKILQLANYSSLAESLTEAQKTIDQNKEVLTEIAITQSHMIRKPLANIIGLINLLNDIPQQEEALVLLELLKVSAAELDLRINEVVSQSSLPVIASGAKQSTP